MFLIAIRNMSHWKDAMVIFSHHHINNMGLTLKSYITSLDSSTLVQVHRTSHNIVIFHIISYPLDNLIFCSLVINCDLLCICQRTDSAYLAIEIAFPIFQHLSTLRLCKQHLHNFCLRMFIKNQYVYKYVHTNVYKFCPPKSHICVLMTAISRKVSNI